MCIYQVIQLNFSSLLIICTLFSGSLDKTAIVQSFKDERLSREFSLKGHEDAVDQIAWHPSDPNMLSTVSTDKTLRLWDIRTPQVEESLCLLEIAVIG